MRYDVIVVGAGPAGSTCAAFCAVAGRKTLLLEKAKFPRDKVCGDCINPSCWPVLERLGVADRVLSLPHAKLAEVQFIGIGGQVTSFPLHASAHGEIAVKRSHFDQLLLQRATECGVEVREGLGVSTIEPGWKIHAGSENFESKFLVAADGRNSSVARALGLLPSTGRERVAVQTHVAAPPDFGDRVALRFLPQGYCGVASIGNGELNICLVTRPKNLPALKSWAEREFGISPEQDWRSIAPLSRRPVPPEHGNLLLIGDAARVVEPFTGEGIFYALASGELAARRLRGKSTRAEFIREHARLYRGRLWVNQLSKAAVLHPRIGSAALRLLRWHPVALRFLTGKVVGGALEKASAGSISVPRQAKHRRLVCFRGSSRMALRREPLHRCALPRARFLKARKPGAAHKPRRKVRRRKARKLSPFF